MRKLLFIRLSLEVNCCLLVIDAVERVGTSVIIDSGATELSMNNHAYF